MYVYKINLTKDRECGAVVNQAAPLHCKEPDADFCCNPIEPWCWTYLKHV